MPWRRCVKKIFAISAWFPREPGRRSEGTQGLDLGWGRFLQEAKCPWIPGLNLDLSTTQHWGWALRLHHHRGPWSVSKQWLHLHQEGSQWVEMGNSSSCKCSLITSSSYSSMSAFSSVQSREAKRLPQTPSRSKQSSKISSPFQEQSQTLLEQ